MVTSNGELYICGGNSGRTLNPGSRGSVYFLTETQAPLTYAKLDEDIIFRISPLGVPSLITDNYNGQLVETEDSYIYTLSVPNEKEAPGSKLLTVKKIVSGSAGDYSREFTFTLTVDSAEPTDGFEWMKNTVTQNTQLHSGDTFSLKHNDSVQIAVPQGVDVTVTENTTGAYSTTFKLNNAEPKNRSFMSFTVEEDTTLVVTNTLEHIVPTGIFINILFWGIVILQAGFAVFYFWAKKKHYHISFLDKIMSLF